MKRCFEPLWHCQESARCILPLQWNCRKEYSLSNLIEKEAYVIHVGSGWSPNSTDLYMLVLYSLYNYMSTGQITKPKQENMPGVRTIALDGLRWGKKMRQIREDKDKDKDREIFVRQIRGEWWRGGMDLWEVGVIQVKQKKKQGSWQRGCNASSQATTCFAGQLPKLSNLLRRRKSLPASTLSTRLPKLSAGFPIVQQVFSTVQPAS